MRKTVVSVLAAVGLAAAALGIADAGGGPAGAAQQPLRYVALGDSYSAASGNLPPDPSAAPQCLRSLVNYPHVLATALHASLRDVTCGGAKDGDYFSPQYPDVPAQLNALRTNTQLVTMTIGGNDSNVFIDSILECGTAGTLAGGQGHPCEDKYGDSFDKTIETTTYPAIVKSLTAVHRRSPHARVAILSYPWILPKTTGCFPQMPVAKGDVPYLRKEQGVLNAVIGRAARRTHSIFVNLNGVSNGHDACQPIGTRWIEPVVGGTNAVIVHPNALGEKMMAKYTRQALSR